MNTNIGMINGSDRKVLSEVAGDSMMMFIGHINDIRRIADTLCYGDLSQAWGDIIEKGILELQKICEMDEDATRRGL